MLDIRIQDGVIIAVPPWRRLDAAQALAFRETLVARVALGRERIVLNLRNVDFVDSSGLGAIVSVMKELGDSRRMVLCCVKESVMMLLSMTGMDRILAVVDSEHQALQLLERQEAAE